MPLAVQIKTCPGGRKDATESEHLEAISERYPDKEGRILQDQIRSDWVLAEGITLMFFPDKDHMTEEDKLLSRHPLNDRHQLDTRPRLI